MLFNFEKLLWNFFLTFFFLLRLFLLLRISNSLSQVEEYVKAALSKLNRPQLQEDDRPGRIGPKIVRFDVATHHGLFIVSPDRLSINSQSNFSTMRANTALHSGKWMYEVQLGSKGVMQIGWGTAQCKFSQESGVGQSMNSFFFFLSLQGFH